MKFSLKKFDWKYVQTNWLKWVSWIGAVIALLFTTYHFLPFTREIIITLVNIVAALAVSALLLMLVLYDAASKDRQLTFVGTGEIKFVVYGKTIRRVIVNVPNTYYDPVTDIIHSFEEDTDPKEEHEVRLQKWNALVRDRYPDLQQEGKDFYWVSILWPYRRVHEWYFMWPSLMPVTYRKDDKDILESNNVVVIKKDEHTSALYYVFVYPVLTEEIELRGNFPIRILVNVTLRVRKPAYIVGNLHAKFMPQLISEITGYIDNGISSLSSEHISLENAERFKLPRKADIEIGPTESSSTDKEATADEEETTEIGFNEFRRADKEAIIDYFLPSGKKVLNDSHVVVEAQYVGFSLTDKSQKMVDALRLKEQKKLEADAAEEEKRKTIIDAQAELARKKLEAEGEAAELREQMDAIRSLSNTQQTEILLAQIRKDAQKATAREIAAFKGKALSIGGGSGGGVMINLEDEPQTREKGDGAKSEDKSKDKKGGAK